MSHFDEFLTSYVSPEGQKVMRSAGWHSWGAMGNTTQEEIEQLFSEEDAGVILQQWLHHYGDKEPEARLTVTAPYAVEDAAWCLWPEITPDPSQTDLVAMQAPEQIGRAHV